MAIYVISWPTFRQERCFAWRRSKRLSLNCERWKIISIFRLIENDCKWSRLFLAISIMLIITWAFHGNVVKLLLTHYVNELHLIMSTMMCVRMCLSAFYQRHQHHFSTKSHMLRINTSRSMLMNALHSSLRYELVSSEINAAIEVIARRFFLWQRRKKQQICPLDFAFFYSASLFSFQSLLNFHALNAQTGQISHTHKTHPY